MGAPVAGSRHMASVQVHVIKMDALAPTEVGSRGGPPLHCHRKPTSASLLAMWTQQMRHLCLTCFPNMTFICLLGRGWGTQEVWEMDAYTPILQRVTNVREGVMWF